MTEALSEIEAARERVLRVHSTLSALYVGKEELIELMVLSALTQEPLLLVGRPGTGKSDLAVKFCEALALGEGDYFEYMLTKFTEPGEVIGPIDLAALKEGRHRRQVEGRLPLAKVAFLDEIFKSNSAILNTLLTIINERKFYQEGRAQAVALRVLFAATNEIPELSELEALRDRFVLKVESRSVHMDHMDALLELGLANEERRQSGSRPWWGVSSLADFELLKGYWEETMRRAQEREGDQARFFPDSLYTLFKRIIRVLELEDGVEFSDRKVIKLYRLVRARAFLFHGGVVRRDDLRLLAYAGNRQQELDIVREKVERILGLSEG